MPKLVRLYIHHVLIGFALSAVFVGVLMWLDVVGLRGLILGSTAGYLAGVMLFIGNGIVFSGAQFAVTILMMAEKDDDTPKGGTRAPVAHYATQPVLVRSEEDRRRARTQPLR